VIPSKIAHVIVKAIFLYIGYLNGLSLAKAIAVKIRRKDASWNMTEHS
jgi:hypothetical protein